MIPSRRDTFQGNLQQPDTTDSASTVITVPELAALLRVNRKSAYAAVARGEVPGVIRVGCRLRVSRAAILAWIGGVAPMATE